MFWVVCSRAPSRGVHKLLLILAHSMWPSEPTSFPCQIVCCRRPLRETQPATLCLSKLQASLLFFFAKHNHQNYFSVLLSHSGYIQHGDNFSCWVLSLGAAQACVFFLVLPFSKGFGAYLRNTCSVLCSVMGLKLQRMIWAQLALWSSFSSVREYGELQTISDLHADNCYSHQGLPCKQAISPGICLILAMMPTAKILFCCALCSERNVAKDTWPLPQYFKRNNPLLCSSQLSFSAWIP